MILALLFRITKRLLVMLTPYNRSVTSRPLVLWISFMAEGSIMATRILVLLIFIRSVRDIMAIRLSVGRILATRLAVLLTCMKSVGEIMARLSCIRMVLDVNLPAWVSIKTVEGQMLYGRIFVKLLDGYIAMTARSLRLSLTRVTSTKIVGDILFLVKISSQLLFSLVKLVMMVRQAFVRTVLNMRLLGMLSIKQGLLYMTIPVTITKLAMIVGLTLLPRLPST